MMFIIIGDECNKLIVVDDLSTEKSCVILHHCFEVVGSEDYMRQFSRRFDGCRWSVEINGHGESFCLDTSSCGNEIRCGMKRCCSFTSEPGPFDL